MDPMEYLSGPISFFSSIITLGLFIAFYRYLYKKVVQPIHDKLDLILKVLSDEKEPPKWLQ